jgi:hypothetical protein
LFFGASLPLLAFSQEFLYNQASFIGRLRGPTSEAATVATSKRSKDHRDLRLSIEAKYFTAEGRDCYKYHKHSRQERRRVRFELEEAARSTLVAPIMREASLAAEATRYQSKAETAFDDDVHPSLPIGRLKLKGGVLLDTAIHPTARGRAEGIFRTLELRRVTLKELIGEGELTWS